MAQNRRRTSNFLELPGKFPIRLETDFLRGMVEKTPPREFEKWLPFENRQSPFYEAKV